jgi:hypothetical protein
MRFAPQIGDNCWMTILVGTAAWTDKSLIDADKFYPPAAKDPESRLKYYAAHFPMVEVDSSCYAMPAPATAQLWAERTPRASCSTSKPSDSSPATRPSLRCCLRIFRKHCRSRRPDHLLPRSLAGDPRGAMAPFLRGGRALTPSWQARRHPLSVCPLDYLGRRGPQARRTLHDRHAGAADGSGVSEQDLVDDRNRDSTLAFERERGWLTWSWMCLRASAVAFPRYERSLRQSCRSSACMGVIPRPGRKRG